MTEVHPHLPFTFGSELILEILDLKLRIRCHLVGMEVGEYLIIKLSSRDLMGSFRSEAIRDGQLVLKFLDKDKVYGYKAQVLNIVSTPAVMFFLSYPKKLQEMAVPKARYECSIPAFTMCGNEIVDMTIGDINAEGCLCVIKTTSGKIDQMCNLIQLNKKMEMQVMLHPGQSGRIGLKGIVRNISKDEDRITVGVHFENLPPESRMRIDHFVEALADKGDHAGH